MKPFSGARFWGIRAGKGGAAHKLFIENGVIALADARLGDLSKLEATRDSFYVAYRTLHPEETRTGTAGIGGKFFRFIYEVAVGDFIVYPALIDKRVYIAEVTGEYKFEVSSEHQHQRTVRWTHAIPKCELSKRACQELGAARTFFEFKTNISELMLKMNNSSFQIGAES